MAWLGAEVNAAFVGFVVHAVDGLELAAGSADAPVKLAVVSVVSALAFAVLAVPGPGQVRQHLVCPADLDSACQSLALAVLAWTEHALPPRPPPSSSSSVQPNYLV